MKTACGGMDHRTLLSAGILLGEGVYGMYEIWMGSYETEGWQVLFCLVSLSPRGFVSHQYLSTMQCSRTGISPVLR